MKRPSTRLLVAALSVGALLAGLVPVQAQDGDQGLGMSPERFAVAAAQPGETYQLTVLLQNRRGFDDTIDVALDGAAGTWASTEPAGPFALADGAEREVIVRLAVPASAGPGPREGLVRFTGTASTDPSGTGASVRPSLGLLLNATVGGEAVQRLAWLSARAEDTTEGSPAPAFVQVRNDGNVRVTAEATGQCLHFEGGQVVLGEASGSLVVLPGETAEVPLLFPSHLHVGQYLAKLAAADGSFQAEDEFKVVPLGAAAPSAELRLIGHEPVASSGRPLRVDGWLENTGDAGIESAVLTVELRKDGELVGVASSAPLAVAAGAHANLTVYLTPPSPGSYTLAGQATYDGYLTAERGSLLRVEASSGGVASWWWILLVLIALTLLAWLWAWRKGRKDRERDRRR